MVFVDFNMELHAAPIAKLGARKMESYRLPFCAVIALWLLTVQVIADQRPVLGQGNISCSLWLEGRQTDSPSAASRTGWVLGFMSAGLINSGQRRRGPTCLKEKALKN